MVRIKKLSKNYLKPSSSLVSKVFKEDGSLPSKCFEASLDKKKYDELKKIFKEMRNIRYFIAVNEKDEVIGTSGLYSISRDFNNSLWTGWFCVDPKHRGKGIGEKLLEYTIREARKSGKEFLKLYTSSSPDQKIAQILYRKKGFSVTGRRRTKNSRYLTIYWKLKLHD